MNAASWLRAVGTALSYSAASVAGGIVVAVMERLPESRTADPPPQAPAEAPAAAEATSRWGIPQPPRPVADARHESADRRFLALYTRATKPTQPREDWEDTAIALGRRECGELAQGVTEFTAATELAHRYTKMPRVEAEEVIDAAITSYCPAEEGATTDQ